MVKVERGRQRRIGGERKCGVYLGTGVIVLAMLPLSPCQGTALASSFTPQWGTENRRMQEGKIGRREYRTKRRDEGRRPQMERGVTDGRKMDGTKRRH